VPKVKKGAESGEGKAELPSVSQDSADKMLETREID